MREALKKGRNYKFNEEIWKEIEDIKKEISDAGFMQSNDPTKKIYVQMDASISGLGYVLYQIEGEKSTRDKYIKGDGTVLKMEIQKRRNLRKKNLSKDQMSQKI